MNDPSMLGTGGASSGAEAQGHDPTLRFAPNTHSPASAAQPSPVPVSIPTTSLSATPMEADTAAAPHRLLSDLGFLLAEAGSHPLDEGRQRSTPGQAPPHPTGSATPAPHVQAHPTSWHPQAGHHPSSSSSPNHYLLLSSTTSGPPSLPPSAVSSSTPSTTTTTSDSSSTQVSQDSLASMFIHPHSTPSDSQFEMTSSTWRYDPLASPDWDSAGPPDALCARRVKKDLNTIFMEPLPGIFAVPQDDNMFQVHCLIVGPFDTPYEGGFFHFVVRFGPHYPLHPPRIRLMTTGGGRVRFNPNLYKNGKVCLSILGTWPGPAWSPASNLSSILLSLQSLLNEKPYHNEPGYEEERNPGDSNRYNTIITHETIRVAVLQQLEHITANTTKSHMPPELRKVMEASFLEYYDHYVEICTKNLHRDALPMEDPFGEIRGLFLYGQLLKALQKLQCRITASATPIAVPKESPASSASEDDDFYTQEEEEEEEDDEGEEGGQEVKEQCQPQQ